MTNTKSIDYLVEMLQPEEGETITAKYLIGGDRKESVRRCEGI